MRFAWRTQQSKVSSLTGIGIRIRLEKSRSIGIAHEAADELVDAVGRLVDFAKWVAGRAANALAVEQSGGQLDSVEIVADVMTEAGEGHGVSLGGRFTVASGGWARFNHPALRKLNSRSITKTTAKFSINRIRINDKTANGPQVFRQPDPAIL
jgi:hypothetical protein